MTGRGFLTTHDSNFFKKRLLIAHRINLHGIHVHNIKNKLVSRRKKDYGSIFLLPRGVLGNYRSDF